MKLNRYIHKTVFLLFILTGNVILLPAYSLEQKRMKNRSSSKDTIQVIGHAHMDMNWLWTYSETMQMCNDNLRQTVAFMKEFPDFTMLQSQAAVYNFVEKVDPPLFLQIKKYVAEGRLELAGGMWTEGDENLSSGEAICRSFLLGQHYFLKHFGKTTNIGWLPDNFGHISQMPQILKLAGCDYFYFHRTKPFSGTFWWIAPDSSKVLCYANDSYNGEITSKLRDEIDKFSPVKRRILHVTGVGDHGGGPTRGNIDMIHQLDKMPGQPAVKFTTANDFFRKSEKEMQGRRTHRGEMQYVFEGCYSTVSDIKAGNRNCENLLFSAEFFNALRWINGENYPANEFRDLWTSLTFNQFHDILPGSAINEANKEAVSRYSEVLRKTTELRNNAFRKMADEVQFQKGMGQPVVAYNLQPKSRKAIVEVAVFSNEQPVSAKLDWWYSNIYAKKFTPIDIGYGLGSSVLVRDGSGKSYPAQIVAGKTTPPGFTSKVQFVADEMPAGGYKTFYVDVSKPGLINKVIPFENNTFETDFFNIKFDMKSGCIISLFDKRIQKEFVRNGDRLNKLQISLEDRKGGMKAWIINKIVAKEDVSNTESVKIVENGPVRACIETVKTWGKSRFIERAYIYRSYPRIDYDMEVHWLETGSDSTDSPMLRAVFPLAMENSKFYVQVPFDVVERAYDGKLNGKPAPSSQCSQSSVYGMTPELADGQEVPAQKWVDICDGNNGIALLNKTKYGYSYHNGDLRLTLMRAAGDPDIYPNLGKFNISYSLFPHAGNWKNGVWDEGEDFNVPVFAAESPSPALGKEHASRPEEASFFAVNVPGVAFSGIKQSEDEKELIIRLAEVEGVDKTATFTLPKDILSVRKLNIIEQPVLQAKDEKFERKSVTINIRAHEIITLGIILKD